jgi:hypothetical protein
MEAGQLLPPLCAHVAGALLDKEVALPNDRALRKRLIRSKASFFYRGPIAACSRLFSELFTKGAHADAGQSKTKIGPPMPHLRYGKRAGNCIRHVARFIRGPRLQNQRCFSGN